MADSASTPEFGPLVGAPVLDPDSPEGREVAEAIDALVAKAPPPTPEQIELVNRVFRPAPKHDDGEASHLVDDRDRAAVEELVAKGGRTPK